MRINTTTNVLTVEAVGGPPEETRADIWRLKVGLPRPHHLDAHRIMLAAAYAHMNAHKHTSIHTHKHTRAQAYTRTSTHEHKHTHAKAHIWRLKDRPPRPPPPFTHTQAPTSIHTHPQASTSIHKHPQAPTSTPTTKPHREEHTHMHTHIQYLCGSWTASGTHIHKSTHALEHTQAHHN